MHCCWSQGSDGSGHGFDLADVKVHRDLQLAPLFLDHAAAMESETAPQLNGSNSSHIGLDRRSSPDATEEPPSKKTKLDEASKDGENKGADVPPRVKGVAPIKKEYEIYQVEYFVSHC